jgi:hypothetical protein
MFAKLKTIKLGWISGAVATAWIRQKLLNLREAVTRGDAGFVRTLFSLVSFPCHGV